MPTIHAHEEGFFILRFTTDKECSEILKGGPYFLNRAPMIVKKWTRNFDFREEIMRVIPVWVRLPGLPLHCWGEETLSRIVSAVGVPILADDCTAKQLKVSYARVLVEVDITQEFVKEIIVRDNVGKEFTQKAIHEWRPYFCKKCNKIGHVCKENEGKLEPQLSKGEGKMQGDTRVWMPKSIVQMLKGVTNFEEMRNKLDTGLPLPDSSTHEPTASADNSQQQVQSVRNGERVEREEAGTPPGSESDFGAAGHKTNQDLNEGDGWTPVAPSKVARRGQHLPLSKHIIVTDNETQSGEVRNSEDIITAAHQESIRDGNPQIPSPQ
ncbi:unnamed protein product [Amaranthus hypochondriacus]